MQIAFMRVDEIAKDLDVSKSYVYRLIKTLNSELKKVILQLHAESARSFSWKECTTAFKKLK